MSLLKPLNNQLDNQFPCVVVFQAVSANILLSAHLHNFAKQADNYKKCSREG